MMFCDKCLGVHNHLGNLLFCAFDEVRWEIEKRVVRYRYPTADIFMAIIYPEDVITRFLGRRT